MKLNSLVPAFGCCYFDVGFFVICSVCDVLDVKIQTLVLICACLLCEIFRLDVYIHDYLVKRDLKASAQAFQAEGKVSSDPVGELHRNKVVMLDLIFLLFFPRILWV